MPSALVCPVDGVRLVEVEATNGSGDDITRWECPSGDWAGPWYAGDHSDHNEPIPELSRDTLFVTETGGVASSVTIDQSPDTWSDAADVTVQGSPVIVLPANATRTKLIVQNTGSGVIRVGDSNVSQTRGVRLTPSGHILLEGNTCPTHAMYAVREGATDSAAQGAEVA